MLTADDLQVLKDNITKIVKIVCSNGEVMVAKIHVVSDEDEDVIYDLISTTKESQYEKHDEQPAYLIPFKDIEHVEPLGAE
jgi:hypothetical protein